MRSLLLIVFSLSAIAACSSYRTPIEPAVSTAYTLQIQQSFDSLPNGTRLDFQHGTRVAEGNLDKWTTYCRLYIFNRNQNADYVTAVAPGNLPVTKVSIRYESSDGYGRPWNLYAGPVWRTRKAPAFYVYQVGMKLDSADQPDIRSLTCYKKWATARANEYPTLGEIRAALGAIIELKGP